MVDWALENGITVVISAGNAGPRLSTITCPANSRNTIAVEAVDNTQELAYFSSRGPTIHGSDLNTLISEISSLLNKEIVTELSFFFENFGADITKKKAKEILE